MKVVVGLSGGVDSSVAAYLLKKAGHEVTGLFMINWHETTGTLSGSCPWEEDLLIAQLVAHRLDIPVHSIDLSEPYRERVVDYMFREYRQGRTPNPDVLCNREIKFDLFMKVAENLGGEMVATGHYCRKEMFEKDGMPVYRLLAGVDPAKDQSYFLCQLSQQQLGRSLFPLGNLFKSDVRRIAGEQRLPTAQKKDSQGICFVGKVNLPLFLQQKLEPKQGSIIEIPADSDLYVRQTARDIRRIINNGTFEMLTTPYSYQPQMGRAVGEHNGAHFFTIGQRKGLNVGGMKDPLFVIATDVKTNIVYVGQGQDHPGLYRRGLFIKKNDIHWLRPDLAVADPRPLSCCVRIRYRQPLQQANIFFVPEGAHCIFERKQRGITSGQYAAWYTGDELVGSGVID